MNICIYMCVYVCVCVCVCVQSKESYMWEKELWILMEAMEVRACHRSRALLPYK